MCVCVRVCVLVPPCVGCRLSVALCLSVSLSLSVSRLLSSLGVGILLLGDNDIDDAIAGWRLHGDGLRGLTGSVRWWARDIGRNNGLLLLLLL